jgi:protease-4
MTPGDPKPRRGRRKRYWILAAFLIVLLAGLWLALRRPPVRPGTVLLIDLRVPMEERSQDGLSRLLGGSSEDMIELWSALDRAAKDPRVEGVLLRVKPGRVRPGKVDELRALLLRFRSSGKFVVAHASAPDTLGYFLATAADEILLDPSTTLDAVGIRLTAFFLKDALAKLGVDPELLRVGDFKGAYEELALPGPTPELEESINAIADSTYQSIAQGVAGARKLEESVVRQLFDRCPLPPDEALLEKMVDRLADSDSVLKRLEEKASKDVHLSSIEGYLSSCGEDGRAQRVAVVHVLGTIVEGASRPLPIAGLTTGADTVVKALRDAAGDSDVAGILIRIDSPGGVVSASEKIHHAVESARKRKPVVASMGGAAASGGYYAACAAEKIFAHPTTLTGSIGVFGGKVVVGQLLERLRVEVRTYARGKRASIGDLTRPYSAEERLALKALLEDSYRRFVDRVATGRKKSFEEIQSVAQGRVWTGRMALGAGLVDEMGGLGEALDALRDMARLPAGVPLGLKLYPPPASLWDSLSGSKGDLTWAGGLDTGGASLVEGLDSLREAGLLGGFARLSFLPFTLKVE